MEPDATIDITAPGIPPLIPLLEVVSRLRAAGCVFAEDEAQLLCAAATTAGELNLLIERRTSGIPLEHVLGWAEFYGMRVHVAPGVFVPRPRSEFLVSEAVALAAPGTIVVDMCCGCGALSAALMSEVADLTIYAADIDPDAANCARKNLAPRAGHVYVGDLFDPLPDIIRGQVNILIANVPYVPTTEIELLPREARMYEPATALDGGPDGLDVLRRIATEAPAWLAVGGHVLIETSEAQAPSAAEIFERYGLSARIATEMEHDATVVIGTR